KTFAGWDAEIPAVMPDGDLSFHAIFMVDSTEDLSQLLTEEEVASGYNVSASTSISVANTAITDELTNQYSEYTVALTLDISILKVKEGETPVTISEPNQLVSFVIEIPDSLKNKGDYIILRDHGGVVEAITKTPNANGEYITVSGNTITLYANKFSLYTLATREPVIVASGGSVASYTVNFDANGGSKVATASVTKGKTVKQPADPVKEGYTFAGWYLDEALTEAFDFETKITKSIKLYAKWDAVSVTKIVLTIDQKDATINGEVKTNDVAPVIVNDRTMLPIRFIAEALGATVSWEDETRSVFVSLGDTTIGLVIGETTALVNNEAVELDCASFIENDRTYLPIRFVMENLGADVTWDETTRTVTIVK
ncbi:MAG: InlB B-repeat-containing protein, partial [Clostridia bacterium]|nr:InlB B-repeat-containing protein [Clostridia bacterium]